MHIKNLIYTYLDNLGEDKRQGYNKETINITDCSHQFVNQLSHTYVTCSMKFSRTINFPVPASKLIP